MLFDSLEFVLFAAAFFAVSPLVRNHHRLRLAALCAFSLFFYAWLDPGFALLLLVCVLLTHRIARIEAERGPRRSLLALAIAVNLTPLLVFKYAAFAARSVNDLCALLGLHVTVAVPVLPLPAGISFFAFQAMAYAIDVHRGSIRPASSYLSALSFISVFPHLVAGPIMRAGALLPQIENPRPLSAVDLQAGARLLIAGFFKKMVLADNLGPIVGLAFIPGGELPHSGYWWAVSTIFAVQLYCDFSGYSDIARGLGKLMGLDFPVNFDHPYLSRSFSEFWTRWHISLSTWFRDYVYFPLGGSRGGTARGLVNLWIVFLLSGLWHGANWTFLLWGAMNAALVTGSRLWPERAPRPPAILGALGVFLGWTVSLVFFRAASIGQALKILRAMFSFTGMGLAAVPHPDEPWTRLWWLLVLAVAARHVYVALAPRFRIEVSPRTRAVIEAVVLAAALLCIARMRGPDAQFIYFRF